jgi:hypothetical protein
MGEVQEGVVLAVILQRCKCNRTILSPVILRIGAVSLTGLKGIGALRRRSTGTLPDVNIMAFRLFPPPFSNYKMGEVQEGVDFSGILQQDKCNVISYRPSSFGLVQFRYAVSGSRQLKIPLNRHPT